jgi:RNA polymerase sigma factor (sigma-70 family)
LSRLEGKNSLLHPARNIPFELEDRNVACFSGLAAIETEDCCLLSESLPSEPAYSRSSPRICAWTDDEIGIVRVVLRRLAALRVGNEDDAEDLVQETLLTATEKLPDDSLRKGLMVWCMGVLRRKLGNYYRKAKRCTSLDDCEALGWRRCIDRARTSSPEAELRRVELQSLVQEILDCLPLQERRTMELYLSGLPAGEIARALYPERYQNTLNRIHRGRRKLARQLSRYGFAPAGWSYEGDH